MSSFRASVAPPQHILRGPIFYETVSKAPTACLSEGWAAGCIL